MARKGKARKTDGAVLPVMRPDAAGIDIGATEIFVAVPVDRDAECVRSFPTFTQDLYALADWLKRCAIETVAMESTGVYWIPLFQILEDRGFEVCLVNARHMKNVPGRRTDVSDCQWLQFLHSVGLLRASYRPDQEVCATASADGSKVVYYATTSRNMDIWILDVQSAKESQMTFTPFGEAAPLISADGSKVYYTAYGKRQVYVMAAQGGESAKVCDNCGTWNISNSGAYILYWYSVARPLVSIGLLDRSTGRTIELIRDPQHSLYQPHFSPDDRWIAFLAKTGQDRTRIYVTPFRGVAATNNADWIPVTNGENADDKRRWSPDGNLIYFTSERDGFRCSWAQRLDSVTKHPAGAPFAVYHFHTSRRSLMNVGLGPLEISLTPNALIFNLGEATGNIWSAAQR